MELTSSIRLWWDFRFTLGNFGRATQGRCYRRVEGVWRKVRARLFRPSMVFDDRVLSNRLLLHTETSDGTVVPVWEEVHPDDVLVLKDIMGARHEINGVNLQYNRIPITAEKPPDYGDLRDLIEVVLRTPPNTPIVVNCQLGRGRSTLASVRAYEYLLGACILSHSSDYFTPHQGVAPGTSPFGCRGP